MTHLISFARIVAAAILLAASPVIAATFTVTNTEDDGAGSLRQAFHDANAAGGDNTIVFDLPGVAQPVIRLTTDGLEAASNITILNDRPGDVPLTIKAETSPYRPDALIYPCFYILGDRHVLLAGLTISGPPGGISRACHELFCR